MEYEGVVVEETLEVHRRAWVQLAEEEGKPVPLQWALKKADGMKAEQVAGHCLWAQLGSQPAPLSCN